MHTVAGLDLSGSPRKPSGLAVLEDRRIIYLNSVNTDEDIIEVLKIYRPVVLAIDSPFIHAKGFREVDIAMKKKGFRVLPPGWRSMKMLIDRCLSIRKAMDEIDVLTIETHPSSCLKSSGCVNHESLLAKFNWLSLLDRGKDELDAVICALVALFYVEERALKIEASDGSIYLLPKICF